MREIKFRYWNTHTSELIEDAGILPNKHDADYSCGPDGHFVKPGKSNYRIVMQYTGLKDKNGKEVYEGDIAHCSIEGDNVGNVDVIEFKNGSFWLRYRDRSIPSWIEFGNEIEVIGNIYEHSELIQSTA